ncbi:hypothetical protein B1F73_08430 [Pseudomonas syringae]|nr:hypothetical protein B1F73_08430 [Pseudomonas syringae]RXU22717.1 hypothetical protein B0A92_19225 [Pseudomonas syringae]
MEDLTQDVRHVRKNEVLKQQETVFQSEWVSNASDSMVLKTWTKCPLFRRSDLKKLHNQIKSQEDTYDCTHSSISKPLHVFHVVACQDFMFIFWG